MALLRARPTGQRCRTAGQANLLRCPVTSWEARTISPAPLSLKACARTSGLRLTNKAGGPPAWRLCSAIWRSIKAGGSCSENTFAQRRRDRMATTTPRLEPPHDIRRQRTARHAWIAGLGLLLFLAPTHLRALQFSSSVVVFSDASFPAADAANASPEQLRKILPGGQFASAEQLPGMLAAPATRLLVLPYGSAFPEQIWPDIYQFLRRGGNMLVLGGRPFTRSAYREAGAWKLRDYNVRFTRAL